MALSVLNTQQPSRSVQTLRRMLIDHVLPFADTIITLTPPTHRYHCHRAILASHSNYFRHRFLLDTRNNGEQHTRIFHRDDITLGHEINVEGWQGVYDYIYGRVVKVDGRLGGLMAEVCKRLEFEELGRIVERVVRGDVGVRNCVEVVMGGDVGSVRRRIGWEVLRKEFGKVGGSVVGLGKGELMRLLKLNDLGVRDDEEVFGKVVEWVYGNCKLGEDVRLVESLVRLIRFPSLDEEALRRIEGSEFFTAYPSCRRFLMQGFSALSIGTKSSISLEESHEEEEFGGGMITPESPTSPLHPSERASMMQSSPLFRPRNAESLTFVDHLQNFSKATTRIRTSARYFAGHLWCLWIDPQGTLNTSSGSKFMSMFLCCLPEEPDAGVDCKIDFSLFVVDQNHADHVEPKEFRGAEFKQGGARIGFPRHTRLVNIFSPDNGYLIDDTLVVGATIRLVKPERSKYVEFLELSHSDSDSDDSFEE